MQPLGTPYDDNSSPGKKVEEAVAERNALPLPGHDLSISRRVTVVRHAKKTEHVRLLGRRGTTGGWKCSTIV